MDCRSIAIVYNLNCHIQYYMVSASSKEPVNNLWVCYQYINLINVQWYT